MNRIEDTTVQVVALVKPDGEKFIWIFDDDVEGRVAALRSIGRFASDKELTFTWWDAAKLSRQIREV